MSAHIVYGIDLGDLEEDAFYDLARKVSDLQGVELLQYFIGEEVILCASGVGVTADYGSVVTKVTKLEISDSKVAVLKAAIKKLGFVDKGDPDWLLTFVGNE